MTGYEICRRLAFPVMPALPSIVRRDLMELCKSAGSRRLSILDVGGRKSPYTIGLPADITILDVPRETAIQEQLNLGLQDGAASGFRKSRSNVKEVLLQDMTRTTLNDASYDAAVSVEVIEHVEEDELFVRNIAKVIRPADGLTSRRRMAIMSRMSRRTLIRITSATTLNCN